MVDLGLSPLCQSQVERENLNQGEMFYPLRAYVCEKCLLVQVAEHVSGEEIFSHYAYFSSWSDSWLEHCRRYTGMIRERLQLNESSWAVEIASNDGYLLQNFVQAQIPCLGIEPATNVAAEAEKKGVPTLNRFFGETTAQQVVAEQSRQADLVICNNVLAHVPDLNDFVAGLRVILKSTGTLTVEFPHLKNLIEFNQFDTIYQEHYSYFSILTLNQVFEKHGLMIYDIDKLATHGGSLRIYVKHADNRELAVRSSVRQVVDEEMAAGLDRIETYTSLQEKANEVRYGLLEFLIDVKRNGHTVCGYGAPGKGNTLLNFCGVREDLLPFTVDRNPFKQNSFLVGSRIPVHAPDMIDRVRPDFILILPWNLADEIAAQMKHVRDWGGKFVVPVPEITILEGETS